MRSTAFIRAVTNCGRIRARGYSAEAGSTVETVTEKVMTSDGTVAKKTSTVFSWSRWSRTTKLIVGGYTAGVAVCFSQMTYSDGKKALLDHRSLIETKITQRDDPEQAAKNEWNAVSKGCADACWDNFFDSIFFPWKAISKFAPYVVLLANQYE